MKVKTREDALLWCFSLWIDIAVNRWHTKDQSSIWAWNDGGVEECYADCPCCEYTNNNCSKCPISWPNKSERCACEGEGSPYLKWIDTRSLESALQIATLALEALTEE